MNQERDDKWELAEFCQGECEIDRLVEELNVLRLEGSLFCFNPKELKKRKGPISLNEIGGQPITIEPHPHYGQPSVLAYRVLQAVFIKMTMEGYPYPDTISFTMRELTRMVGREWSGAKGAKELYNAVMQLRSTLIHCVIRNKGSSEWETANFQMLSSAGFEVKRMSPKACVIEIDRRISRSLNLSHVAFFNLSRLNTLDVIGMVMYKRLFFHLSNLYQPGKVRREELSFCKDYEDICREWLGGLKPERYKSKILLNQLGRHLEGLRRTRLIRRCDIEKKVDGSGFKLTFYPGRGFFDDYEAYYLERQQPRLRFKQTADLLAIQQPIEVVAYFHELLGHEHNTFDERERAYAAELLKAHSVPEVRDLVEYTVEAARETNFRMQRFGALSQYRARWESDRRRRQTYERKREAIKACPHCNEQGMLLVRSPTGAIGVCPCPHDAETIIAIEQREQFCRIY